MTPMQSGICSDTHTIAITSSFPFLHKLKQRNYIKCLIHRSFVCLFFFSLFFSFLHWTIFSHSIQKTNLIYLLQRKCPTFLFLPLPCSCSCSSSCSSIWVFLGRKTVFWNRVFTRISAQTLKKSSGMWSRKPWRENQERVPLLCGFSFMTVLSM